MGDCSLTWSRDLLLKPSCRCGRTDFELYRYWEAWCRNQCCEEVSSPLLRSAESGLPSVLAEPVTWPR
jgi:hypothetical protein